MEGSQNRLLSYVSDSSTSSWNTYLAQVDRVLPHLGKLARYGETLKRPKRALIVDIPIDGRRHRAAL
jgi:glutamate dehydrogenase (NAD(P)+)